MKIIVDTREQLPFFLNDIVTPCMIVRKKLEVGDYSTDSLVYSFAIERKSPQDLYGTITRGHRRFRNMLLYAEALEVDVVMFVECSRKKFVSLTFDGGGYLQANPATIEKIICTIETRYKLEIVWCKNRNECKRKIYERLKTEEFKRNKHGRKN